MILTLLRRLDPGVEDRTPGSRVRILSGANTAQILIRNPGRGNET